MNYKNLSKVSKPARYINGEINSVHKDPDGKLRFCLAFPDVYEVGMSHVGFKMLYEKLNEPESLFTERFFMPWPDACEMLGDEIFCSLESGTPLKEFDLLGFSVQYELSYTNILQTLKFSGIPLKSSDRDENDPVIIAGGSCVLNPAPLSYFIDVFFMGEMDSIEDIFVSMQKMKEEGKSRKEIISFLDEFTYTYVPELNKEKTVIRRIETGFSDAPTLTNLVVPAMPVVQDRVAVEISRGCTRGCRFCQAGMVYRPAREKSVDSLIKDACCQLDISGYTEVSMLSLSAADYSRLDELLMGMANATKERSVSLSMPSMRADKITENLFKELSWVRKSGFTIAPEAGSARLRDVINKNLSEEEILDAVVKAADAGWKGAKLYFMIGLPTETDEDVLGIAELALKAKRAVKGKNFNIKVSVSNYVPKAHTPFQWYPMNSIEELMRKRQMLRDALWKVKIGSSFHWVDQSYMEGVFSRGDERLGDVLVKAVEKGLMFDAWTDFFNYDSWKECFDECGLTDEEFSSKEFGKDEKLPWNNIESGVTKKYLWDEYEKSLKAEITTDCKVDKCTSCGVCDFKEIKNTYTDKYEPETKEVEKAEKIFLPYSIKFSKKGRGTLLSALEITKLFEHAFRIAGIDIEYTKGFNPGPKMRFFVPLPVGVEGENEVVVVYLEELKDGMIDGLQKILPDWLVIKDVAVENRKLKKYDVHMTYRLGDEWFNILEKENKESRASYPKKDKKGRDKVVSLADYLVSIGDCEVVLAFRGSGLFNLLEYFETKGIDRSVPEITRTGLELVKKED